MNDLNTFYELMALDIRSPLSLGEVQCLLVALGAIIVIMLIWIRIKIEEDFHETRDGFIIMIGISAFVMITFGLVSINIRMTDTERYHKLSQFLVDEQLKDKPYLCAQYSELSKKYQLKPIFCESQPEGDQNGTQSNHD